MMALDLEQFALVVFHNPEGYAGPDISPIIQGRWDRPVVELLVESEAPFGVLDVGVACARFIGWYYDDYQKREHGLLESFGLEVISVPELPDPEVNVDEAEWIRRKTDWYEKAIRWLASYEPCPCVMVNLSPLEITQRGVVLWRPPVEWQDAPTDPKEN